MNKLIFAIFAVSVIGTFPTSANAQMMNARRFDGQGFSNSSADWEEVVEHTLREESEGRVVWDKLQAKELACENLSDEQFGVLGEYFMGQMTGNSHAAMNAMMIQTHGEDGEEQIHIVMGRRLSGCDTSAAFPAGSGGWMPMMNMMWGGWSSPFDGNNSTNNMMNFGFGSFGGFGWIFMILWWVLIIAGIAALIKWLTSSQSRGTNNYEKSASPDERANGGGPALEILKERYAKGEINKKEFEEKKKDLGV
jgi:putative membrane protein